MRSKVLANKWVEKKTINKKLDKAADGYAQRVLLLTSPNSSAGTIGEIDMAAITCLP